MGAKNETFGGIADQNDNDPNANQLINQNLVHRLIEHSFIALTNMKEPEQSSTTNHQQQQQSSPEQVKSEIFQFYSDLFTTLSFQFQFPYYFTQTMNQLVDSVCNCTLPPTVVHSFYKSIPLEKITTETVKAMIDCINQKLWTLIKYRDSSHYDYKSLYQTLPWQYQESLLSWFEWIFTCRNVISHRNAKQNETNTEVDSANQNENDHHLLYSCCWIDTCPTDQYFQFLCEAFEPWLFYIVKNCIRDNKDNFSPSSSNINDTSNGIEEKLITVDSNNRDDKMKFDVIKRFVNIILFYHQNFYNQFHGNSLNLLRQLWWLYWDQVSSVFHYYLDEQALPSRKTILTKQILLSMIYHCFNQFY